MKNSIYSSFTDAQISEIENQIVVAQKTYKERFDRYLASVSAGHQDYARKNFLPAANEAKAYLDQLQKTYEQMLASISKVQNIDLVDSAKNDNSNEEPTGPNWKTIGLAIGALVAIVIIIKFIK